MSDSDREDDEGVIPDSSAGGCLVKGPTARESSIAGAVGGVTSVAMTYPIHKIMFRQMLHGISTSKSFTEIKYEGFRTLFRGMAPPLYIKGINTSTMFGSNIFYKDLFRKELPSFGPQATATVAAIMSGCTEAIHGIPLERIQTLLMNEKYNTREDLRSTFKTMQYIKRTYGVAEIYRGGSVILLRNSIGCVLYFGGMEKVSQVVESEHGLSKYLRGFIVGGLIGGISSSSYYPLNVIKSRMQSDMGGRFPSMLEVFKILLKERGSVAKLYGGVHLNLVRASLSWAIVTATTEYVRTSLLKARCPPDSSS